MDEVGTPEACIEKRPLRDERNGVREVDPRYRLVGLLPRGFGMVRLLWHACSLFAGIGLLAPYPFGALAADADHVEKGAAVYALRCAGCHGEELRNLSGGWSFDLRRLRPDQHDQFVQSVISGRDNMPSWYGVLKMDEIEAIWSYIRATVDK